MSSSFQHRAVVAGVAVLVTILSACAGAEKPKEEPKPEVRVSALASDPNWIEVDQLASRHGFRRVGSTPEGRIRLQKPGTEVQIDPLSRVSFFAGNLVLMPERPREDLGRVYVAAALDRNFADLVTPTLPTPRAEPVAREPKPIPGRSLSGRHFVLDAGHGGKDSGALGGGLQEKDIVLDITMHVGQLLRQRGAEITYTRTDDRFIPLDERAAISNRARPDAFLSIHVNAAANRAARGVEVFRAMHRGPGARADKISRSATLAVALEKKLALVTPVKDRGVKESPGFRVLKLNDHPAVLLELGFLSNPDERGRLGNDLYRRKLAEAIVLGLETWSARR